MQRGAENSIPELLAPAGHIDALRAALAAGADAVYFGGKSFSNRMRAKNFDSLSIRDAISLAHSCGARAYITVNTRLFDDEMSGGELDELLDAILGTSADASADALIVADFGVARYIRKKYPHAVLHASTQTSLSSPADCEMLREAGFTRLVLPRELSGSEIRRLSDSLAKAPLDGFETEMFIHGAHCVSLSGQCLLSYVMGGRSGNRGECAQPCRLPYTLHSQNDGNSPTSGELLSLADMCLAGRITDVISSGVTSLKLEGRLKSADYVFGVTRIYRRLLDERRNATNEERRELEALFSRGFTDGYFCGRYAGMSASERGGETRTVLAPKEISRLLSARIDSHHVAERERISAERVPVKAEFTLRVGEKAALKLSPRECESAELCAEVFSADAVPECGSERNAGREYITKSLVKTGSTPFSLAECDITFDLDGRSWLPTSALNDMRRRCAALLEEKMKASRTSPTLSCPVKTHALPSRTENGMPLRVAVFPDTRTFTTLDSGTAALVGGYFDFVYLPAADIGYARERIPRGFPEERLAALLPPLTPDDGETERIISRCGVSRVLCSTPGQIMLARRLGMTADVYLRANITSSESLAYYAEIVNGFVMQSPEALTPLSCALADGGVFRAASTVYGAFPVMVLARCVFSAGCGKSGKCPHGRALGRLTSERLAGFAPIPPEERCRGYLTDRKNVSFPVFSGNDCVNYIYSAKKLKPREGAATLSDGVYIFTDESPNEIKRIIRNAE